ncbi:pur operon repressor [Lactobacillus psittaci]|uniref:Pur operon repressor n=1 Tax=Lactobacillus psittaci DSM 15354 TaxID=1122152 RepID=A0A0R1S9H8_9LACO|nr:pur operon repressor [Lactobacillus psittaci]KRL63314.1 pur operon repressor [Lactobacillus psittaci DSM 15354]
MKRSERLVDMTKYLLERPHTLISLPFFAERYGSAKSSISEDLAILKHTLAANEDGILETVAGAAGGVRYIPFLGKAHSKEYLADLANRIEDTERILPGGFVYLSDILGSPKDMLRIGQMVATHFAYKDITAVMTIETKGIPLAEAVSRFLNVPFVTARKKGKVTEGSTVSVNYLSSSSSRVAKMELPTKSLAKNSNVLIIDDFMKGGGTLTGMEGLVREFDSKVGGICVLCETSHADKMVDDYISLIKIDEIDTEKSVIKTSIGNFLDKTDFNRF